MCNLLCRLIFSRTKWYAYFQINLYIIIWLVFLPLSTNCYRCICRLYLYNVPQNLIWLDTITDLGSLRFQWNFQAWSSLGRVVLCLWCQVLQKSLALFCCTCRFPAAWICLKVLGQYLWLGVCLQVQQTPFLQPLVGYCY